MEIFPVVVLSVDIKNQPSVFLTTGGLLFSCENYGHFRLRCVMTQCRSGRQWQVGWSRPLVPEESNQPGLLWDYWTAAAADPGLATALPAVMQQPQAGGYTRIKEFIQSQDVLIQSNVKLSGKRPAGRFPHLSGVTPAALVKLAVASTISIFTRNEVRRGF